MASPARSPFVPADGTPRRASAAVAWGDCALILLLALAVRAALFYGFFGSDDSPYYRRALDVAQGQWQSADYNGALRYGFNLPAGLLMRLLGASEVTAVLWPLACSLVEIACVYRIAAELLGRRGAAIAALLLASAPLHIAVATRIHADSVTAAFLTLTFTCLFFGLRRRSAGLLFAAGLSLGSVYWAKELAALTWLALVPMLAWFRGRWRDLLPCLAGVLLMLLLHGLLMVAVAGDPLHLVRTVLGQVKTGMETGTLSELDPAYYLRYLFLDIRHTGLLTYFALLGVLAALGWRPIGMARSDLAFLATWFLALLLVMSLFPISFSPLRLAMRQSNYITLFLAPLALLAAFGVTRLSARWAAAWVGLAVLAGLLLGGLQQADWRAFTANSKALAPLAQAQPGTLWVGSTNNQNLGALLASVQGQPDPWVSFRETQTQPDDYRRRADAAGALMVVLDPQTLAWYAGPRPVTSPLACWEPVGPVAPIDLGLGNWLAGALAAGLTSVPLGPARRVAGALERLAHPLPATVYRVQGHDVWCGTP